MRKYETFFIVDPDLSDEIVSAVDNKVQSIVTSNKGEVLAYNPWGKRKLAYPIRKRSRGLYILMEYSGGSDMVAELERNLRIDERVLKFITVKLEDRFDAEKERERRAAAAAPAHEEQAEAAKTASAEEGVEQEAAGELKEESAPAAEELKEEGAPEEGPEKEEEE
jgi:small subunit ribosomal protein S6